MTNHKNLKSIINNIIIIKILIINYKINIYNLFLKLGFLNKRIIKSVFINIR